MRSALLLILRIFRVGRVRALFLIELFLLVVAVSDCLRYQGGGLSVLAAVRHVTVNRQDLSSFFSLFVSLFMGVPLLFAVIRLTFSPYSRHHGKLARGVSHRFSWIHFSLSIILSYFSLLLRPMVLLSGLETYESGSEFAFTPMFRYASSLGGSFASLIIWLAVAVIVPTVITYLTRKTHLSDFASEIASRLCLLDLRSELYPVGYSPRRANFISGAIAPGIEYVHLHGSLRVSKYDGFSPGSVEATEYLRGIARECRDRVKQLFLREHDATSFFVSFAPSTTRALEIVLSQHSGRRLVLLSPFEHPAEQELLHWLSRQGRVAEIATRYEASLFEKPPSRNVEDISLSLCQHLESFKGEDRKKVTLIISEVCWATGVRIPIERVIRTLRDLLGWSPSVIIDGAHALGNDSDLIPKIEQFDCVEAYVFSGHKWLFSSTPVGVIVTRKPFQAPFPVDLWREDEQGDLKYSTCTSGPMSLCYFAAALDMFQRFNRSVMFERSRELRGRLNEACRGSFRILGIEADSDLDNHSFIISLVPIAGMYWKNETQAALRKHFDDRRVYVNVVRPHEELPPAIRVTLPYFQNVRDLDMLLKALRESRGA